MRALQDLRNILKTLAQEVEVLPAVGGAVEDLELPDFEEREDLALIQKPPVLGLQVHFVNVAPNVLVGDLLKTTRASQIFTVFGQPDVRVEKQWSCGAWTSTTWSQAKSATPEARRWPPGS